MYRRNIKSRLLAALSDTPVVLLHGPRQAGKTTLVRGLTRRRPPTETRYVTLVDIVIENPAGDIVGIEVKAAATIGPGDFRGLNDLRESAGKRFRRGLVLYSGNEVLAFGDRLHALPIAALWRLGARPQREDVPQMNP